MVADTAVPEKFGTVLGVAPGEVHVFSSHYESADASEFPDRQSYRSFLDGQYMGQKWQCVEFARRWLYVNHGQVFDDVAMAHDIFRLQSIRVVAEDAHVPLRAFRNGSPRHPGPGALLIWDEGGEFPMTGHVAIVVEATATFVRIAEQNYRHHKWLEGRQYSRELKVTVSTGGEYHVECDSGTSTILGWVMQTDDEQHAEIFEETDARLLQPQIREATGAGDDGDWLDLSSPDEAAYVRAMAGQTLATAPEDHLKYVCISETALAELKRATTELHSLFMHATNHVLQNEGLFEKFGIPRILLPRIRQSWNNRRSEMITGRFDFALSHDGLKAYEYNCDSASCHLEAGKIQGKWAEHVGCTDGFDAGRALQERLIAAWRKARAEGVLHIMHDRDDEETYHAYYMQQIVESAGIPTKVLRGLKGLSWGKDGEVLDPDGESIRFAWKTWAWETALDQLREECAEDDDLERLHRDRTGPPRLLDVLLRPGVMVFEPLWTLIPSNKAILPVLWRLCPNHPYLLNSAFTLRDPLPALGYAIKPIVGRGGANITLVDNSQQTIVETGGKFEERNLVYQELWPLPCIDGLNVQICTFSAGGAYGGSSTRVDRAEIIKMDSDCLPLRVVPDENLLAGLETCKRKARA